MGERNKKTIETHTDKDERKEIEFYLESLLVMSTVINMTWSEETRSSLHV